MMISDAQARAAALQADKSFIVQAPAGSGKTGLLVYRMLTLLAAVDSPQQVLAITFTRKATAEMLERLLSLIRLAEGGESSEDLFLQQGIDLAEAVLQRDRANNWNLLDSPHQLQILTIDAFCARLTTSMPWLSRLGDRPRITDNAEVHYAVAVEQLLAELLQPETELSRAIQTVMLEMDFNYNKARRLFSTMLAKRDQWLRHLLQYDLNGLRSSLEHAWQTVASEQLAELYTLLTDAELQRLVDLAKQAAQKVETKGDTPSQLAPFEAFDRSLRFLGIEHWRALRHLFLTGKDGKGNYRKAISKSIGIHSKTPEREEFLSILKDFEANHALEQALLETDFLPELRFGAQDWQQLVALEQVLKALAGLLQLRFRAVGECDHSEVTQRANLALQELDNPTDLGLRLDHQLRHILVDEFQDTSHGQIELLKRLTAGWDEPLQGGGRTLFLVGDPMQSIYRFREADVSLFLRVTENSSTRVFENLTINTLVLSENFRSNGSLVDWFNSSFKQSFPDKDNVLSGAIKYAKATTVKPINSDSLSLQLASDHQQQAYLLVDEIQQATKNLPDQGSKVAVLVRTRAQLNTLLPAVQAAGINYAGVDIQPLNQVQAVIDVLALVKAICREDDRLAWLALLRGPWCGLSLCEIKLTVPRQDQTVWQQLDQSDFDLPPDSQQRLLRFIGIMQRCLQQRQQTQLSSLTRWTWQMLGGEHTLYDAHYEDIETVLDLIAKLERGGDIASVSELDKAIDKLYAKASAGADSKVIISTIHKAKGLQYHTVILPSLSSPARASDKDLLMWAEHQNAVGDSQLLLAPLRIAGEGNNDHYGYLRQLDRKRAANEAVRLMYVACTRAQHRLVLLGLASIDDDTQEVKLKNKNSLLGTVWDATKEQFAGPTHAADASIAITGTENQPERLLSRLEASFSRRHRPPVGWQAERQLNAQISDDDGEQEKLEYEWATEVATAVGIVLHGWLQFAGHHVLTTEVDQNLRRRWRAELSDLRVAADRIDSAVKRLERAAKVIQKDHSSHFLFVERTEQQNEYTLAALEHGLVTHYRIDRTFIDQDNIRWIVDYKSTVSKRENIAEFVDEQVATRHRAQLQKYGALMSQLDDRPIKLAIYFPMLGELRSWDYL